MADTPRVTPKDFFLWLGAMAALYASVISFLTLFFQYINRLFPDQLDVYVDPFSPAIRFSIATLIVVFPVYLILTRMLNKDIRNKPEKKELWVRRWLIFITLFVAGATIVGDLIALINTFLGGELTARFLLKVLAILVVVGTVFGYYLYDLRGRWEKQEKQSKTIGGVVVLVVLVSIISGFFIIGSPQTQREIRFDQQKVNDLQTIQWQVVNYWQQKGALPGELSELEDPIRGFRVPTDPQTGEPYTYEATDGLSFVLCAVFNHESLEQRVEARVPVPVREIGGVAQKGTGDWQHGAGEICFDRSIDPELYPPRER